MIGWRRSSTYFILGAFRQKWLENGALLAKSGYKIDKNGDEIDKNGDILSEYGDIKFNNINKYI